jgi:hypothetical protein
MDTFNETHESLDNELIYYVEMGALSGENGNQQEAVDYYMKGLLLAKECKDRARIQQFSNLIFSQL